MVDNKKFWAEAEARAEAAEAAAKARWEQVTSPESPLETGF